LALDADVRVRLGAFRLDCKLRAEPGGLVVLVGPNGAGKTTLLRALAGLQQLDDGRIVLDDQTLDGSAWVPPHKRRVGLVPQNDRLFPHLDALANVAFGLRYQGVDRAERRRRAQEILEVVGLSDHAHHRPDQLSAGQAKRVALARALAMRPRLLLLDEPLASLDASTRRTIRRELRRYLDSHDCIRIMVTHEPVDALALADRIVVLEHGHVVQDAAPDELRVRPRSRYVAELVGVNLYRGDRTNDRIRTEHGAQIIAADAAGESGHVLAVIHPKAVALHQRTPEGSPRNVWEGTISEIDDEGDRLRVRVEGPLPIVAEITPASAQALGLAVGGRIYASVKATEVAIFPA
jgi:molybdate transport system ATP-binding protein